MPRLPLAAVSALALALASAMACTSLKSEEPVVPGVDGSTPLPTDGATLADGATQEGDAAKRDDASPVDSGGCATACIGKPISVCNGTTSETTLGIGRCVVGQCVFPKVTRPCKSTCAEGLCTELTWGVTSAPTSAGPYYAVWGAAPDDLWAGGDALGHFDGTRWTLVDMERTFGAGMRVFALSGSSSSDVALLVGRTGGGGYSLYRLENGTFVSVTGLASCDLPGGSLYARSATEYFVHCGDRGVFRVTTTPTVRVSTIVANPGSFPAGHTLSNALGGFVLDDGELSLMAAGASVTHFYSSEDGGRVQQGGTRGVSVLNGRDVYGMLEIGLTANLYPTDGGSPLVTTLNTAVGETEGYWRSMVGTSFRRVFVGGTRGVVARYDGTAWHRDTVPEAGASAPFVSLWASPWGDVYGTGQRLWEGR